MKLEFTIEHPSRALFELMLPYMNKQGIKRDIIKYVGKRYYSLSLTNKKLLLEYWIKNYGNP